MDVRAQVLVFPLQDFEGLPEIFDPGRPHDRPRDVRRMSVPKTFSLGCFFVPDKHLQYLRLSLACKATSIS